MDTDQDSEVVGGTSLRQAVAEFEGGLVDIEDRWAALAAQCRPQFMGLLPYSDFSPERLASRLAGSSSQMGLFDSGFRDLRRSWEICASSFFRRLTNEFGMSSSEGRDYLMNVACSCSIFAIADDRLRAHLQRLGQDACSKEHDTGVASPTAEESGLSSTKRRDEAKSTAEQRQALVKRALDSLKNVGGTSKPREKDIWALAGYTEATQYRRWKYDQPGQTTAANTNIERTIRDLLSDLKGVSRVNKKAS